MAGEKVTVSAGSPSWQRPGCSVCSRWGNGIQSQAATPCQLPFSYRALRQGCKAQGMPQSSGRTSNSDGPIGLSRARR